MQNNNNWFSPLQFLNICSLNVRGLSWQAKRREMFNWLREKNFHVFFLQEVHCAKETCDLWQNEWGYKALFSCENSRRAGVAILFKNDFDFVLIDTVVVSD